MTRTMHIGKRIRRFLGEERGAALVEFAIALPLLLLVFAVIIEGSRLFWSYQMTAAGVRDAARYLARVAEVDSCTTLSNLDMHVAKVTDIVRESSSGNSLLPSSISIPSVSTALLCIEGPFRLSPTPVAQVTATVSVTFPFAGLFGLISGSEGLSTVTTTVTDQSRIFGT